MPLTSSISPYDPLWPQKYEEEAARVTPLFGRFFVSIHHVGSTAVPDLAAKPEIDLLVVFNANGPSQALAHSLEGLGYRRGGDLSPNHHFFKRNINGVRTHKLHVCQDRHPKIGEMMNFRNLLRGNVGVRVRYQALKLRLEKENTSGIGEYLAGKAPFIQSALQRAE